MEFGEVRERVEYNEKDGPSERTGEKCTNRRTERRVYSGGPPSEGDLHTGGQNTQRVVK